MKKIARFFIVRLLAFFAHTVIAKYRPKIVMVTGSIGKTSTKDAIAAALRPRFYLRASEKSYNSEFGVPFTVLGVKNPWRHPTRWLFVCKEALALLLLPNHYPTLLVLEVGADRPRDLERILEIATPDVVVVTELPEVPVHVEAYATPEALREEEFSPAYALAPEAPLIVNAHDTHALAMSKRVPVRLLTYGEGKADVSLGAVEFYSEEGRVAGMQALVRIGEEQATLVVRGSVGNQQILPGAAALATALALGVPFEAALAALAEYVPPPGRGRLIRGAHDRVIIDETYNSSPAATAESLETLRAFPHAKRRIAILGDMLELGRYSVVEHERIGKLAREVADLVLSVGIRARAIGGHHAYNDAHAAIEHLKTVLHEGDVILIKGSQSIRMERIVEALLADKADSVHLVRQEPEWRRIP